MSPRLWDLRRILTDAASGAETEARTLARLAAAHFTADPRAVADALAAMHDLQRLDDDPTCARTLVPGLARSPWVDAEREARLVLEQRLDEACVVLARRPAVAA